MYIVDSTSSNAYIASLQWKVYSGTHIVERIYWNAYVGTHLVERNQWNVYSGTHLVSHIEDYVIVIS